jgi:hypothetical protein
MYSPPNVKTSPAMPIAEIMRAWVLGDPNELKLVKKPVPVPGRAEILVRVDAVAICASCRQGMYTSCLNYGLRWQKHSAQAPSFCPEHARAGSKSGASSAPTER